MTEPPPLPRPGPRWSVGPDGKPRIVLGLPPAQWVAVITVLMGGGTAYGTLATEGYVNAKVEGLAAKLAIMATKQGETAEAVAAVKAQTDIMVRLGTAQYAREERRHTADAYALEVRQARRRRAPEPPAPTADGPAAQMARKLKVDPDRPLQGIAIPDG